MKNQALFSSMIKVKKKKISLLQFLYGALRVKDDAVMVGFCKMSKFLCDGQALSSKLSCMQTGLYSQ